MWSRSRPPLETVSKQLESVSRGLEMHSGSGCGKKSQ